MLRAQRREDAWACRRWWGCGSRLCAGCSQPQDTTAAEVMSAEEVHLHLVFASVTAGLSRAVTHSCLVTQTTPPRSRGWAEGSLNLVHRVQPWLQAKGHQGPSSHHGRRLVQPRLLLL